MAKKKVRKSKAKRSSKTSSAGINFVWSNLITSSILFIISLVLYFATTNLFWADVFFVLTLIFGILALTFLISFLVLYFSRK